MEKVTDSLGENELVEKLTMEIINLLYLNGAPNKPEAVGLESTIALVAEAWELPQDVLDKSRAAIDAECEVMLLKLDGEEAHTTISQDKILESYGGEGIMTILWGLFETSVRLDTKEKRRQVLQIARFLAEFLGMGEWLTDVKSVRSIKQEQPLQMA